MVKNNARAEEPGALSADAERALAEQALAMQVIVEQALAQIEQDLAEQVRAEVEQELVEQRAQLKAYRSTDDARNAWAALDRADKLDANAQHVEQGREKGDSYVPLGDIDEGRRRAEEAAEIRAQVAHGSSLAEFGAPPMPATWEPKPRQRVQEEAILDALRNLGFEPTRLPLGESGRPGVKSVVRKKVHAECWRLFQDTSSVFDKAWQRMRNSGEIRDADK